MSQVESGFIYKVCLVGILLMTISCSKYIDDDSLFVGRDKYRLHRSFGREPNRIRMYTDDGVLYFTNSCGPLYSDKTEDKYCYYLDFEIFIKEEDFVSGVKVPITKDYSQEEWYKKDPKDFGTINSTKAALWVERTWDTDIVSKSLFGYSKSFKAINGWIKITEQTSTYAPFSAEYDCEVVAFDDGEVMKIHGSLL